MENIKILAVSLLAATLWNPSVVHATTPTISGVSGTVSTGQTLTVSGSSMMDLDSADWSDTATHSSFESASSLSGTIQTLNEDNWMWLGGGSGMTIAYDATMAINGDNSVKITNSASCIDTSSCGHITLYKDNEISNIGSRNLYFSGYVKYDWSHMPTHYMKFFLSDGPDQFYFQPINGGNDGSVSFVAKHDNESYVQYDVDNGSLEWHHWEVHVDRQNGVYEGWWDGRQIFSHSTTTGSAFGYVEWGIPNFSWIAGTQDGPAVLWMDAQVISTSRIYPWAKIEISDNATYGSGTVKYQEPVYLSDGSVQIKADLTDLGDGPYYLFVTNNRQERSAAYSLSGGSPPPPSDVVPGNLLFSESFESAISDGVRGWIDGGMSDIVAGGYSGNAMRWSWAEGATQPTNSTTIRKALTSDQEKLFVRMRVKYDSNWIGSGVNYHPHMLMIRSGVDYTSDPWGGLANNYLNTYIETVSGTAYPYNIVPMFGIQDQQRVNTANGTPPVDLRAVTENRSTGYCNQPAPSGWEGICYSDNPYYSAATVAGSSIIPKNEWVTLDTYMEMNTITDGVANADGHVVQWVDGEKVSESSDVMFRTNQHPTMGFRQFVFGPWIGDGSPIAQSIYIDELEVYDGYSVGVRGGRLSGSLSGGGVMR